MTLSGPLPHNPSSTVSTSFRTLRHPAKHTHQQRRTVYRGRVHYELGIQHRRDTPLWPRANGEVEHQNRTLLKAIKVAHLERKPWQAELTTMSSLLSFHSAFTSGISLAELLFRRPMRSKLSTITATVFDDTIVCDRDSARKQTSKDHADRLNRAAGHSISKDDNVLVRNPTPTNKLSPTFLPDPYLVVSRHGD